MNLPRRVLPIVPRVDFPRLRRFDVRVKESGVIALEDCRDSTERRDVRCRHDEVASGFQDPVHLGHEVHGVLEQMFDQFAAQNGRKVVVLIGKSVLFGVKMVNLARKFVSFGRFYGPKVGPPELPVVAPPNFPVSQLRLQGRRDLEIGPHFENPVAGSARRRNLQRLDQPGFVGFEVGPGLVVDRPTGQVFAGNLNRFLDLRLPLPLPFRPGDHRFQELGIPSRHRRPVALLGDVPPCPLADLAPHLGTRGE